MSDNLPAVRASLVANPNLTRLTFDEMQRFAKGFELAGSFEGKNYKPATMPELFVRIAAGQAMGIDPFTAVSEFYTVKGKLSMSTNLQLALAKATGKYRYRITFGDLADIGLEAKPEWPSPQWCKFVVFENEDGEWNEIGETIWSLLDSERAGLLRPSSKGEPSNHLTYNRAMLKNRAGSQAINFFMPDATMVRIYDTGEHPDDDRPLSTVTAKVQAQDAEEVIEEADVVPDNMPDAEGRTLGDPNYTPTQGEVKPGETVNEAMARMEQEEDPTGVYPFDPAAEPPPVVVRPPEPVVAPPSVEFDENVRTITPKQVSYAHVLARDAKLDDETRKRIMFETTGVIHTDRIPFDKFQDFVAALVAIKPKGDA